MSAVRKQKSTRSATGTDESDRLKRSLEEISAYKRSLDQNYIMAKTDPMGHITYVNDKFCQITGYTRDELLGQDHRILNSGYHPKKYFKNMWDTIKSGKPWYGQVRNKKKNNEW